MDEVVITGDSSDDDSDWGDDEDNNNDNWDDNNDEDWDWSEDDELGDGGGGNGGGVEDITNIVFEETLIQIEVDEINPLFFVNCASFEYYKPPGSLVTAAAVDNMSEKFYATITDANGNIRLVETMAHYNRVYFTMPSYRRNGEAANIIAEATTQANNLTQAWYIANPNATKENVSLVWRTNLKAVMAMYGGQFSEVAPFPMGNAGEYQTSLLWPGNCD